MNGVISKVVIRAGSGRDKALLLEWKPLLQRAERGQHAMTIAWAETVLREQQMPTDELIVVLTSTDRAHNQPCVQERKTKGQPSISKLVPSRDFEIRTTPAGAEDGAFLPGGSGATLIDRRRRLPAR